MCDAHVHFLSHRFFALLAAQRNCPFEDLQPVLEWDMPLDPVTLASIWIKELDRHNVARASLIASLPTDETSVQAAVQAYPDRFHGYFMVNPAAPDSLAAVQRALAAGLQGICLFPAMQRYSLHDPAVLAILEEAAARPATIVFIHCGVLTVGVRPKLGLPSPFDMRFSNPLDVHNLALRFPRLPFVIPHFGAGMFREALMLCDLCPNVYLDTSSTNSWMKYQEPGCSLASVFQRALAVAGPHRLLFGTDSSFFPRGWHRAVFDQQVAVLHEVGVDAAQAEAILGGNLRRLLC
ncbi:MAG: amidohydrolase family protein [Acidobacteriia bacterium]|nr:amidohydrolase family protein [Terriglobia bacterium]